MESGTGKRIQEEKMLDLKFVRENPDIVKKNIENKFQFEKLPLTRLSSWTRRTVQRKQRLITFVHPATSCPSRSVS